MFHAAFVACVFKLTHPRTKVIFSLHNNIVAQFHRRIILWFTKPLRNADIIFPGSEAAWYQKSNAVPIANGVDTENFHVNSNKPPVFTCLFAGRLTEQKDPLFLIELVKAMKDEYQFIIKVAGDGELLEDLKEEIEENNLSQYFQLSGYQHDMPHLLANSHCLLIPSLWEGMPLILLEAGASGIPVIATDSGNIPYVLNSSNGYCGEQEDFPNMLADVMDNYGEALIKARKLMELVKQEYSIGTSYRRHAELYKRMNHLQA
jgi:glycosyltransferase involved in cell wall biosynthesis